MSVMIVRAGRVFADTPEEAMGKIGALHPSATRIEIEPIVRLRQGIWWEYHAVFEEAAA